MTMHIGTFYDNGARLEGLIATRKLNNHGTVIIAPYEKSSPDSSEPDYLVYTGPFQTGRGWKQITKDGKREYMNLIIDATHGS